MAKQKDPRPKNKKALIEKFRKRKPVFLNAQSSDTKKQEAKSARGIAASGLEKYTGAWGETQAMHLLNRVLFGVKKSELEHFKSLTLDQAIAEVLTPSVAPNAPVNDYNNYDNDNFSDAAVAEGETWIDAPYDGDTEGLRTISLKGWWIKNIINQKATLSEKMLLFWHNLLAIQTWEVFTGKASYQYVEMLRTNSFGNYKTLIKELTKNPAMLYFLNGAFNEKDAPDENYGRELQELFCIGKGKDANFTEGDVQAAARVLTGWTVDISSIAQKAIPQSQFIQDIHDTSDKQFSSFYGNTVISGKTGAAGAEELDDMLDMIFGTNELATYISRRLYNFFVSSNIDETVEQNMIQPMADLFRANNYEIKPLLEALFKSAHFYDALTMGVHIKSPSEHSMGIWRTLNTPPISGDGTTLNLKFHSFFLWETAEMGMEIGDPPSVSGWTAYYQTPQYDKAWITTATITLRALVTDAMVFGYMWVNDELEVGADLINFVGGLNNPSDATAMLTESTQLLLGLTATADMITTLKEILLSGQVTDAYWSGAWSDYVMDPNNAEYRQTLENRLRPTFQHILQFAESQLM